MSKEQKLVNLWGRSCCEMWKHFGFETITNELGVEKIIENKVVCRECGKKLLYSGSTTSMNNHWNRLHRSTAETPQSSKETDSTRKKPPI